MAVTLHPCCHTTLSTLTSRLDQATGRQPHYPPDQMTRTTNRTTEIAPNLGSEASLRVLDPKMNATKQGILKSS